MRSDEGFNKNINEGFGKGMRNQGFSKSFTEGSDEGSEEVSGKRIDQSFEKGSNEGQDKRGGQVGLKFRCDSDEVPSKV